MDGIPVKINEKYKPPPKITLPACILNRLNNTQFYNFTYDFSLETTVAEHMTRLNKISQDELDRLEKTVVVDSSPEQSPEKTVGENSASQSEQSILTPVPISSNQTVSPKENNCSRFKYSDFENDTSSPFDNEELKTINDMEELAHVLGIGNPGLQRADESVHARVPPISGNVSSDWPALNYGSPSQSHYYHQTCYQPMATSVVYSSALPSASNVHNSYQMTNHQPFVVSTVLPKDEETVTNNTDRNEDDGVAEIVKSLQDYIGQRRVIQNSKDTRKPISTTAPTQQQPPLSFQSLGDQEQAMARRLGEMGFTLSSATAAVKLFSLDESKIVEYLLLVQSFVEKGYDEAQTISALEANSQDVAQTERYLDVLSQIMRLGFKEDEVATALARTKNDRDKALDILIRKPAKRLWQH